MKKFLVYFLCFVAFYGAAYAQDSDGVVFQYRQKKGDSTSHVAEVMEAAYFNGFLSNKTQFINRMTTTVQDELDDGAARLQTNYMITQNTFLEGAGRTLSWGEESTVNISRTAGGQLFDSNNEELPTVRGVPSFPDYAVKPGDSWQMPGEEVHDCKELFQMTELIRVPFTATYKYSGDEEKNGKILSVIDVYYEFSQSNRRNRLYRLGTFAGIQGRAVQKIYWDKEKCDLDYYEEAFEIEMFDVYGNSYYFTGESGGNVTEYKSLNNDENLQKIKDTVAEYNLQDVSVTKGDKGLTISVENIQFEPDSDILMESEKIKLSKIGEILKTVSNDLLITGHCADRGTEPVRQKLSESRAESVASFLMDEGVRDQYHIFTQGKGAREPIATNDTEAGRAKNRRVEITIMDYSVWLELTASLPFQPNFLVFILP